MTFLLSVDKKEMQALRHKMDIYRGIGCREHENVFCFCENCKIFLVVVVGKEEGILSGRILLGGRRPPRDP